MPVTENALVSEVVRSLLNDLPHAAVDRFDVHCFEKALRSEAGAITEDELIVDVSDFTGDSSNWVLIEAGYDGAQRILPAVLRVAARHQVVVYSDAEERIVTMSDAMAGLARADQHDGEISLLRDKYQAIVHPHLTRAAARFGFKSRGTKFARKDADRVMGIYPVFEEWSRAMRIDVSMGSESLARFLDDHRRFCQEPPLKRDIPTLAQWYIGEIRPSGGRLRWKLDTEDDADVIGAHSASTLTELIGVLSDRFPDLRSLAGVCGEGRDAIIHLASINWLLGEHDHAMKLVDDRLTALDELIRTRYFPPDKGERVDLQFFKRFLESRAKS